MRKFLAKRASGKIILAGIIVLAAWVSLFVLARRMPQQQPATEDPVPALPTPLASEECPIVFEPASVDFGVRHAAETISQSVFLRNVSDKPVRVTDVSKTCGCATAALAADSLAPGEAVTLEFKIVLEGRMGPQRMAIHVQVDGTAFSTLLITGTVQEDIRLTPSRLSLMQMDSDAQLEASFTVTAMDGIAFRITDLQDIPEGITVGVETNDGAYRVTLSCDASLSSDLEGRLTLLTDHPWRPTLRVPFAIRNTASIISRPAMINLSTAKAGTVSLSLFSPTAIPFTIARVEVPDGVAATPQRLAPHVYRLTVAFPQTHTGSTMLRVHTSTGIRLDIPVRLSKEPDDRDPASM